MKITIVTRCPGGTTTSWLAARRLEQAAQRRGWEAQLDTAGERPADATGEVVVVAASVPVDLAPLAGRRLYRDTLEQALADPDGVLARAEQQAAEHVASDSEQPAASEAASAFEGQRIVAVTACPTGVAHTFMAAEALGQAGRNLGHHIRVETQGSVGAQDALSDEEIAAADVVLLACDIEVDDSRFAGKRIYRTSTGSALKQPTPTIEAALAGAEVEQAGGEGQQAAGSGGGVEKARSLKEKGVYKHLLTGVSFMLPMVVAGGLCIALSFVFGIRAYEEEGTLASALMQIGSGSAFKLMVPVLAGYIAYSIADRPGIAPGMIGGWLASTLGAGFIGGIIAGFLAGYSARGVVRFVKLPASVESLKPILIIPLLASLATGLIMIYVIGTPVAAILSALTEFLNSMGSTNAILLGLLLGGMMCIDMGGPINKAAYTFGVGLLSSETYAPMAAIMAAGMIPPLGMGIASMLARSKFATAEREAGKASFVLGLCFITEGAIPFAAKDPLRVLPACIAGGAVTGALSMFFHVQLMAPHGGLFVMLIPNAVNHALLYLLAIAVGAVITGVGYSVIKRGEQAVASQPA
ncbi:PTS system D-fructose-specific IIB component (F1P-forming) (Frc family) /PTS system D-fructose-specific IIC component (F1P-forming) (Frc family) [Kushneria sinocarnis]|uniref:protein-N(pi)-phosphohistidine--D-fructose phosphotransferase n=1 Tax=Kushneria sinocarnis TaxID=595502 RepID=A0A420WZN7_9GAMM|nr:fructose-specific PTS transporter subunit EIIC [Kushneria sinocarnis]RKR06803.1 PTS system D-fructose-specific IIB component (F1P-forming) (Frc family) /PTS system D-fructose-specific IIC component (F1P-forming) (Frc family) [Kushneria sinocarnis]